MNESPCSQLDDYMLGWLSPDEAIAFEHHMQDCQACRREQELQNTIDGLLAGTGGPMDAIPQGLVERTRYSVRAARKRNVNRWVFCGAAAAAVMILAIVGGYALRLAIRPGYQEVATAKNPAAPARIVPSNAPPGKSEQLTASSRVELVDPSFGIVVECKTRDPRINIVWIYPAVNYAAASGEQP